MRTRIKICGITRVQDALAAARLGADAIGLVFYPPSPRHIDIEQAKKIAVALPPFVTTVALFVDAEPDYIARVVDEVAVDLLQFHGNESPSFCAARKRPWIKAIRMKQGVDLLTIMAQYSSARGILLDAYHPGIPGGTGETFDWKRIPSEVSERIILAGGLNTDNIEDAVRLVQPYAVDVSGGVEVEKGIKDLDKIARFMRGVRVGEEKTV